MPTLVNKTKMNSRQYIFSPSEARLREKTWRVVKRSVDARQRDIRVLLTVLTDEQGNPLPKDAPVPLYEPPSFRDVHHADRVVHIIGAGPAGLFAALTFLEHGVRPIIFERGNDVTTRKRDIARLQRGEGLNPESNYCFGEGGAGTFSDGKLFSRSKKRGDMQRIMELFHFFGASDAVLYEAHAHIGSDRLPAIVRAMRECIVQHGGEIHFGECVRHFDASVPTLLCIGHSAHDTYRLLASEGVAMRAKGCAIGVRMEHPQSLINHLMYHLQGRNKEEQRRLVEALGNASYALVTQVGGRGVYSFCMCPGGHIVPAASEQGSCVVNGMSTQSRSSAFANSGLVVEIPAEGDAMQALERQEALEQRAWQEAQHVVKNPLSAAAPAQRMRDFVEGVISDRLPECSYLPGIVSSPLHEWLPQDIRLCLQQGLLSFDKKYGGLLTNEAVLVGVESRSSSPVRIVRDPVTMQSVSHSMLYPCGEGAGYAGGITSSALDGRNAALKICLPEL